MKKETVEKIVDIVHDVKDVAKNVVEPASKNAGSALGTFTGFFSNVVLYPLKCLNAIFEQKAIAFEKKVKEKYNKIPEEDRVDSPVNVLGPTLESLKYNINEDFMQELFANLLTSSMDRKTQSKVHPKYVQSISAMNETDAKVFKFLFQTYGTAYIKCGRVNVSIKGTQQYYATAMPEWSLQEDVYGINIFDVSKSLIRLSNLGLIDLMYDRSAGGSILSKLYERKIVQDIFEQYKAKISNVDLTGTDCIIKINDDGRSFAEMIFKED